MKNLTIQSSREWVRYFRCNGLVAMRVPWHLGADLQPDERRAIAHSIRVFQLGESSEGRHLMRYARQWAGRADDCAYAEAIRMLIAEEQRHAAALARFMEMNGIARLKSGLSDRVFRRLRNMFGTLEVSLAVLVTAEIAAKTYYPAIGAATNSVVLRAIFEQIHRDEIAHVEFQTGQLARMRAGRSRVGLWITATMHRALFYPTAVVVAISHHVALRRGGLGFWAFLRKSRHQFLFDLAAMDPRHRDLVERPTSRHPAEPMTLASSAPTRWS